MFGRGSKRHHESRIKRGGAGMPPVYELNEKDRKLVGLAVIYRMSNYSPPKLGFLSHRTPYGAPGRELGAWVVTDDETGMNEVIAKCNHSSYRLATEADMKRYKIRQLDKPKKTGWFDAIPEPAGGPMKQPAVKRQATLLPYDYSSQGGFGGGGRYTPPKRVAKKKPKQAGIAGDIAKAIEEKAMNSDE